MKALHAVWMLAVLFAVPALAEDAENGVIAKEKSLWVAWTNHDGAAFQNALTPDSVQVITGMGEVKGRDAIVKAMSDGNCTLRSFDLKDMGARRLAPDIIILSYSATQDGACGQEALPKSIRATAIYVRRNGKWLEHLYQETPTK